MKFLLVAAFATFAYTQNTNPKPQLNIMKPPIAVYEAEILTQNHKKEVQEKVISQDSSNVRRQPIILGNDEFNPKEKLKHEHKGTIPGQKEFNPSHKPLLGEDQFNPSNFIPPGPMPGEQQFNPSNFFPGKPDHRSPWHDKMHNKHDNFNEKDFKKIKTDENMPPPPISYQDWEDHVQNKHMKRKFHKKMCFMFILTAIIFTLFGLFLGKCFRKCKKNKRKQVRQFAMRLRNSNQIAEEIKDEEKKLDELRTQYRIKKGQEEREAEERRQKQSRYIELRQHQRPMYPHVQPYITQPCFYNPRNQIPIGRPLNESHNSSFATEYPQL